MMTRRLVWALPAMLVAAFVSGAFAQGTPRQGSPAGTAGGASRDLPSPEEVIERLDRDGDGRISRQEFQGPPPRFATIDSDKDGFLTADELRAARQGAAQGRGANQPQPLPAVKGNAGGPKRTCTFQPVTTPPDSPYGVDVYSPDCMFPGTTLFGDVEEQKYGRIAEVDFSGRVIWSVFAEAYYTRQKGAETRLLDVKRLPSGNTLFTVKNHGALEIARDGKLVWRHLDNYISHDVDRLPNGNTLFVRGWAPKGEDHVREVDPAGKLVWSWNGLAQYDKPPFAAQDDEGWIHANAVTRLANGNTVISLRNFDRTVEVDRTGTVVHEAVYGASVPDEIRTKYKSSRGSDAAARPHEPEILPNGNILVALSGLDRVVEVTKTGQQVRLVKAWPIQTDHMGIRDVNRLPNGNTLVVGYWRIVELSPDGQVVWSLHKKGLAYTGHKGVQQKGHLPFYKAQRIAPDGSVYGG